MNEITEEDITKDTNTQSIVKDLPAPCSKVRKLKKKETSSIVLYFMPERKETLKVSAFQRFFPHS